MPAEFVKLNNKGEKMATKQELFEQLTELWGEFETGHNAPTKKSDADARKALGEIKKLVTSYRASSVSEGKK